MSRAVSYALEIVLGTAEYVSNLSTRRLRQKDYEFEPSLVYMASSYKEKKKNSEFITPKSGPHISRCEQTAKL